MGAKFWNISFQQNIRSWAEDDLNAYFHEKSTIIMLSAFARKIHQQEGIFFWGGGLQRRFPKSAISWHIRVQITQESVWLIALIGFNMFCIHIAYIKSLKKISDTRFSLFALKKCLKMAFFGVFKAFISNFLYYNLY